MTDQTHGAFCAKPTIKQRLWRFFGFRWRYDESLFDWRNMEPPEEGYAPGAFITETHVKVSWDDRLRILVSGHIAIEVCTKTDIVPKKLTSRSRAAVLPPT